MKKYFSLLLAGILMIPATSMADNGNYLEFSIMDSSWDSGVSNVSGATLDEDDSGFAITAGMPLNHNLDLEFGYVDFGEASLSGSSGNTFDYDSVSYTFNATATIQLEGDSIFIGLKPKMSITDSINAYARLGFSMWDTTLTVSTGTTSADISDDGNDLYYGFGVSGNMGGLNISLSHSNYEFDSDDVDSTSLSVSFKF